MWGRYIKTRELEKIIELGQETKELYNAISKVNNLASHILGKNHKISKNTLNLYKKIVALKSDFEDEFWSELNNNLEKPIKCFYGEDNPKIMNNPKATNNPNNTTKK